MWPYVAISGLYEHEKDYAELRAKGLGSLVRAVEKSGKTKQERNLMVSHGFWMISIDFPMDFHGFSSIS